MKSQHLTSLIAFGALLPLTALGQATGSDRDRDQDRIRNSPSGETQTPSGAGAIDRRPGHNSPHYAPGSGTTRDGAAASGMDNRQDHQAQPFAGGAAGQIQRVSSDQLDQRVTASSLIGKKVVDRDGQDVGKIKDIGLGGVVTQLSQHGTQASAQRSDIGQRNQSEPRVGQATGTRADTYPDSGTGMTGSSPGSSQGIGQSNQWNASGAGAEARIFVQPDRALGARGDLVAIPASQLRREGDNFRVDMSRDQLRTLVSQSPDRATSNR